MTSRPRQPNLAAYRRQRILDWEKAKAVKADLDDLQLYLEIRSPVLCRHGLARCVRCRHNLGLPVNSH